MPTYDAVCLQFECLAGSLEWLFVFDIAVSHDYINQVLLITCPTFSDAVEVEEREFTDLHNRSLVVGVKYKGKYTEKLRGSDKW